MGHVKQTAFALSKGNGFDTYGLFPFLRHASTESFHQTPPKDEQEGKVILYISLCKLFLCIIPIKITEKKGIFECKTERRCCFVQMIREEV